MEWETLRNMIHHRPHDPPMLSHEDRESLMGIAVLLIVVAVMMGLMFTMWGF